VSEKIKGLKKELSVLEEKMRKWFTSDDIDKRAELKKKIAVLEAKEKAEEAAKKSGGK